MQRPVSGFRMFWGILGVFGAVFLAVGLGMLGLGGAAIWRAVGPVTGWQQLKDLPPDAAGALAVMVTGVPFAFVGGVLVTIQIVVVRRMLRVVRNGVRRKAVVLLHQETGIRVNSQILYRLIWQDQEGNQGQSRGHHPEALKAWPPGSEIVVYADPLRPELAVWEEDAGAMPSHHSPAADPGQGPTVRRG